MAECKSGIFKVQFPSGLERQRRGVQRLNPKIGLRCIVFLTSNTEISVYNAVKGGIGNTVLVNEF